MFPRTWKMSRCLLIGLFLIAALPEDATSDEWSRPALSSYWEAHQAGLEDEEEAGEEDVDLEDILSGFDDTTEVIDSESRAGERGRPWDLSGSVTSSTSYNYAHNAPSADETDYRGLSRLRQELQLDLEFRPAGEWKVFVSGRAFRDFAYAINGRDRYTDETLDLYEDEAEFREVYLQGRLLRSLDIKIGRQIVVWARSDNTRVTDVLTPLDNREPGMVDIEDLRLPVTMTRLDYYRGDWHMTVLAIQ